MRSLKLICLTGWMSVCLNLSSCLLSGNLNRVASDNNSEDNLPRLEFAFTNAVVTYTCAPITISTPSPADVPLAVTEMAAINLSGLGTGSAYASLTDCQHSRLSTQTVYIAPGQSAVTFYYRSAQAETLSLNAQNTKFASGHAAIATQSFQVLGQTGPTHIVQLERGEDTPSAVYSDGTRLYVADTINNRVLVWNAFPTSNGETPDFVLGQPDRVSTDFLAAVSGASMDRPAGVFSDGSRLFVADTDNNRVLVWNTIPTRSGQPADFALGQPDLVSGGGGCSSTKMNSPRSVASDGTRLFVADTQNNRVLVWNAPPTYSGQPANFALGQPTLTTGSYNQGGLSASSLALPYGVFVNGSKLFVADTYNNRVLVWNSVPTVPGQAANFALGQPDLVSGWANNGGLSASSLYTPYSVCSDGARLYVADTYNSRILVWNALPTFSGQAANIAIGQSDLVSDASGVINAASLSYPSGTFSDGTRLLVADGTFFNRVLVWNLPSSTGQSANLVLGQPDFMSTGFDNAGVGPSSTGAPNGAFSDGTRLFVADSRNNRVLVWNALPTSNGQAASFVLGQPDFTSSNGNNGGVSAASMASPYAVFSDGTRLFVADANNHRILVWNAIPSSTGQPASFALGQPDLTSNTANNGGVGPSSMNFPNAVYSDGTRLFVADSRNNRVLVWNTLPHSNGQPASFALGQPNLTSNIANNGGVSGTAMDGPCGVFSDRTRLFVVDNNNSRVLGWSTLPTVNGESASFALGQPSLASSGFNHGGLSASSMYWPSGVFGDGTRLFVADSYNNRVLTWNTPPVSNAQAADAVLGQPGFNSNTINNGSLSAASLNNPCGVFGDGLRLFISDTGNNRIAILGLP